MMIQIRCTLGAATTFVLLLLSGCAVGGSNLSEGIAAPVGTKITVSGHVMGGQQPVQQSNVQLWAVQVDGSGAQALLTSSRTSGADGGFDITADYSCPNPTTSNPSPQVYLTAMGGNAGSGTNGSIALMAALGTCSALTQNTVITINEVTTVAAVWALRPFLGVTYGTAFADNVGVNGSLAQSVVGMQNAFATAANLANIASGTAGAATAGAVVETAKINTIADLLASCVNSDGTTPCQSLFAAVTPSGSAPASDTIQAALAMAQNPTFNLLNEFSLIGTSTPFQPTLSAAPYDWTLAITYTGSGLSLPHQLAVDAAGDIWIDNVPGSPGNGLVELGPTGAAAASSPFLTGTTLSSAQSVSIDTNGIVWVANAGSSANDLVSYNPATTAVGVHNASSNCLPGAMALDGSNNAFYPCGGFANLQEFVNAGSKTAPSYSSPLTQGPLGSSPEGIAIDATGNVWVSNNTSASVTEFAAGNLSVAANTFTVAGSPYGIAADHSGDIWVASTSGPTLTELVPATGGSYTTTTFSGAGLNSPRYLAIDGGGNIWVANSASTTLNGATYVSVSEFSNAGTALSEQTEDASPGGFAHAVSTAAPSPRGLAIDPSGNVWVAGCGLSSSCTSGSFVMELVGAAAPVVTPLSSAIASNQLGCCSFTPPTLGGTAPAATAGYISLQATSYSFDQNTGSFSFEVTRSGGTTGAIAVNYSTTNGSAIAGTDYTSTSGTLSWAASDSSVRTITVPFLHNANYTGSKSFVLTLSSPTNGAVLGPIASTVVSLSDNLTPPSSSANFALSGSNYNWKLQLPVDVYGGDGGTNGSQFASTEIANSQLVSGFSDPYFYLNAANQIVFTAPSNGATTSPGVGTNDTRSELRELYTGPGADSNNDWTNSIGGTLTATCTVNAVSVDSDEATIGQIHAQTLPFVLLLYLPATQQVAVQVTSTNSSSSGSVRTPIVGGIGLGTTITYKLAYSGSTLTVTVNGVVQTLSIDSSWSGAPQYFKLGSYSAAPNVGNPAGDETQVTFSAFQVTHP